MADEERSSASEWARRLVTPQEVIDAYVEQRVEDPSLLTGSDDAPVLPLNPRYEDFIDD